MLRREQVLVAFEFIWVHMNFEFMISQVTECVIQAQRIKHFGTCLLMITC